MTAIHKGTKIKYDENTNQWVTTINGRERCFGSLAAAKTAIDTPPKSEKRFDKCKAYRFDGYDDERLETITVTSIAERGSYGWSEAWIVDSRGRRQKVSLENIFVFSPANLERFKKIDDLRKQIEKLQDQRANLISGMDKMPLPK